MKTKSTHNLSLFNQLTLWRLCSGAVVALLFIATASAQTTAPPLPVVTSGTLQLWLEADAGVVTNASGQVSEWQDQSGNANDAFQANADYQPLLVYPSEIGGRAAVRFDGNPGHINYLSGTGNVGVSNAMTSFVVVNEFSTTLYQNMVWLIGVPATVYGGSRSDVAYTGRRTFTTWAYGYVAPFVLPTNTYRIWTDRINTNLTTLDLFDISAGGSTNFSSAMPEAYTPAAGYYVGGINPALAYVSGWNLNGDIAEWIVFKGYLSEADRLAVQSYLQQKYNLGNPEASGPAPFTNSLVAYYPFNGNADDATGHGNNGQIVGNVVPSTDRFGNASGAYAFDGVSSSAIEVTNTLFNIGQTGYTVSGWFASSNAAMGNQVVVQSMPQAGMGVGFGTDIPGGYLQFGVGTTGSWTADGIHGSQPCANQTWYQFVFTKSGTLYTLYLDGQVLCQQTIPAASEYDINVGCIIGSITPINPSYQETFLGRMSGFRVYNRALSSNEVQELYAYESVPQTQPCVPYPATATVTVVNGGVVGATVTDGGCGYTNTPLISFSGGGGTGATVTAIVSNGVVIGLTIINPGTGYTSAPAADISSPLSAPTQAPFTNSLVAYYPFNGNANDATGHGNNGQIVGNVVPSTDRFGNASGAYAFDGVSSSAIEVSNTLFNIGQPGYTVSGWFASSNATLGNQVVIQSMPQAGMGVGFGYLGPPGYLQFGVGTTFSWTADGIHGSEPCANQTWYQFVFTKSGTLYTLYLDGQVLCQQTISTASEYNANVGCIIGSITPINPSYEETFLGRMSDFRIYNRALSSSEVQELYAYESVPQNQAPPPALPAVTSGTLQLWLEADAGVITNASGQVSEWQDQSGNANHASQVNAQNQPLLVYPAGLGGRAALRFNGIQDKVHGQYLHGPGQVNLPNALTAFAVYNAFNETNLSYIAWLVGVPGTVYGASRYFTVFEKRLNFGTWAYDSPAPWDVPTNTYRISTDRVDTNLSTVQLYDTSANSGTNFSLPIPQPVEPLAAGYYIGGVNPSLPAVSPDNWDGDIAEVIIYSGYLSEADRLAVSDYLQQKYFSSSQPPPCIPYPATATATVVNGFVVGATVTDGGCGYTNVPLVSFIGGGGSGAAATAVLSNGIIVGITITDAGSGYTTAPTVQFNASITPAFGLIEEVAPVFSGLSVGAAYQLQVLSGVNAWADYGSPFVATNFTITYPQFFSVTNCDQLLFRLLGPPAIMVEPINPSDGLKKPKAGGRSLTTPPQGL
ncbi:MAG: LamG domain-containing protein [Limisphaerales bacterium]